MLVLFLLGAALAAASETDDITTRRALLSMSSSDYQCHQAQDSIDPEIDCLELGPASHTFVKEKDLEKSLDWRFRGGKNLVTPVQNQHIPQYCGSCWAFASLGALSDRIKIARNGAYPEIQLSPQALLNCGEDHFPQSPGTCHGGWAIKVYQGLAKRGVVDETCQAYQAKAAAKCTDMAWCRNCHHDGSCNAVKAPSEYKVKEHGVVTGEHAMAAEIQRRGPIACSTGVTDDFFAYKGGVFHDKSGDKQIRHVVTLLGWGEDSTAGKYWIGRNSWGSYWGENGYFKIAKGINNLGIESQCFWGTPDVAQSNKDLSKGFSSASQARGFEPGAAAKYYAAQEEEEMNEEEELEEDEADSDEYEEEDEDEENEE